MNSDIWKDIPGFEGKYQVSNKGAVRNTITGMALKQSISRGYYQVGLYYASKTSVKKIHSLVAMSFFESRPKDPQGYLYVVNHKDGDKLNNSVENLEYVSTCDNTRHYHKFLKPGRTKNT